MELKEKLLGISPELIKEKGVVNHDVALAMAKGVQKITGSDIALSSTGVAGPTEDQFGVKPGIAFIAIVSE